MFIKIVSSYVLLLEFVLCSTLLLRACDSKLDGIHSVWSWLFIFIYLITMQGSFLNLPAAGMRAYDTSRYRTSGEPTQPSAQQPPPSQPDSYSQVPKTHRVMTLADHISVRCVGNITWKPFCTYSICHHNERGHISISCSIS